jgi:hypothetical protein
VPRKHCVKIAQITPVRRNGLPRESIIGAPPTVISEVMRGFRLPSQCKWIFTLLRFYTVHIGSLLPTFRDNVLVPSSRVKHSDVSGQRIGPIFEAQVVQTTWHSKMGPIGCPEISVKSASIRCVKFRKSEDLLNEVIPRPRNRDPDYCLLLEEGNPVRRNPHIYSVPVLREKVYCENFVAVGAKVTATPICSGPCLAVARLVSSSTGTDQVAGS